MLTCRVTVDCGHAAHRGDTAQMFTAPGKAVMRDAYKNKTDIIVGFVSEDELAYDYRDDVQRRA
jgi:hypothetical protein